MFLEQSGPDIHNTLKYSLEHHQHQKKILSFLRNNLREIANKLVKTPGASLSGFKEDDITGEIHNLLNDKLRESSGYLFRFEAKSGPDILIFAAPYQPFSKPLFVIEAKRLPPTSKQDYVLKGIGRFKIEEHAKDHDIAAMLGYVQDNGFDYWYEKINAWIDDLIVDVTRNPRWVADDKLNQGKALFFGEYESIHCRKTRGPIMLYHFWLDFCSN